MFNCNNKWVLCAFITILTCLQNDVEDDTVYVKSVASSPDTESYEFLNGQTPDKEEIEELPQDDGGVETLVPAASSTDQVQDESGRKDLTENKSKDMSASNNLSGGDLNTTANTRGDYEDDEFEDYMEEGETEEEEIEEDIVMEGSQEDEADDQHPDLRKRLPRSTGIEQEEADK